MIAVTNRLYVQAEYGAALEESFQETVGGMQAVAGFLRNQVLRPTREGDPYVVLTYWESHDHFQAWVRSDTFKQMHRGRIPKEAYIAPNQLEVHEIALDVALESE
jgi:heme-degrading monooxygenase HmoA